MRMDESRAGDGQPAVRRAACAQPETRRPSSCGSPEVGAPPQSPASSATSRRMVRRRVPCPTSTPAASRLVAGSRIRRAERPMLARLPPISARSSRELIRTVRSSACARSAMCSTPRSISRGSTRRCSARSRAPPRLAGIGLYSLFMLMVSERRARWRCGSPSAPRRADDPARHGRRRPACWSSALSSGFGLTAAADRLLRGVLFGVRSFDAGALAASAALWPRRDGRRRGAGDPRGAGGAHGRAARRLRTDKARVRGRVNGRQPERRSRPGAIRSHGGTRVVRAAPRSGFASAPRDCARWPRHPRDIDRRRMPAVLPVQPPRCPGT